MLNVVSDFSAKAIRYLKSKVKSVNSILIDVAIKHHLETCGEITDLSNIRLKKRFVMVVNEYIHQYNTNPQNKQYNQYIIDGSITIARNLGWHDVANAVASQVIQLSNGKKINPIKGGRL